MQRYNLSLLSILAFVVITSFSCSNSKKANKEKEAAVNDAPLELIEGQVQDVKEELEHIISNPNIAIYLERTPCRGECPNFKLSISKVGNAEMEGYANIELIGSSSARLPRESMEKIFAKANEINYWNLKDAYDSPAMDIPTTYIFIRYNNQEKAIRNRMNGPESLNQLAALIYEEYIKSKPYGVE
jgi:hypothetical protein